MSAARPAPTSPSARAEDVDRETFDYLMRNDIATLMDTLCRHLMRTKPRRPQQAIASFLNARQAGRHGGVAIAGTSAGGGWLRVVDGEGNVVGSVDRIPFRAEASIQFIASSPRDQVIFMVTTTPLDAVDTARAGGSGSVTPTHRIARGGYPIADGSDRVPAAAGGGAETTAMYNDHRPDDDNADDEGGKALQSTISCFSFEGARLGTFMLPREVAALTCDRDKGYLWILFRGGGGVVMQPNGTKIRDLTLPPAQALAIGPGSKELWLLAGKNIEKRDLETTALELVAHLPDSMLPATSFTATEKHIWCAAANSDGSSNFVGCFDLAGRAVPNFVPPPGSVLAHDALRGGMWHLSRHCAKGLLSFTNDRSARLLAIELGRCSRNNIVVDAGSGLLWHYRSTDGGGGGGMHLGLLDPLRGVYVFEIEPPLSKGNTTHMIAL